MRDLKFLTTAHDVLSYVADDGRIVVLDAGNPGWAAAVAAGPAAYAPPASEPLTIEDYKRAVQAHLDAAAQSRLYTDGNSLATYTASTNEQWAAEADAFVAWRDAIWQQVYALWDAPPDPLPTPPDLIALLPEITWP